MKTTRTYTMTSRARGVAETRRRVLDATVDLHGERLAADISLDDIAERAGVSVQTVLRHFGSRSGLVEAAFAHARSEVEAERRAPVGDVAAAVRAIVDHYELRGDGVLVMLAQEPHQELMARITRDGRRLHRTWVEEVFAPYLRDAEDPDALADLLVVATDVYTWKLLRRDRGLGRDLTENRIHHLVRSLLGTDGPASPRE
jgi:AcrR family transcriptional regulator